MPQTTQAALRAKVLRQIISIGLVLVLCAIIGVYIFFGMQMAKNTPNKDTSTTVESEVDVPIDRESILSELEKATSTVPVEEQERIIDALNTANEAEISEAERNSILEALAE